MAILDYGSGNLRSAQRAFELAHSQVVVTNDPKICEEAQGLVVPGVGAFAACMDQLIGVGGREIIAARVAKERPIFGICVGMQVLFDSSNEKKNCDGVGVLQGEVDLINAPLLPHMGWNNVSAPSGSKLFQGVEDEMFYFVHSYAAKTKVPNALNTTCEYGEEFIAAVERDYVVATQFHPEKSGDAGAKLISNWVASL
ncbi:MAG: imidazole glycerol phosphate synthase subunit HisH [Actinobacteria bacterium]|nr:imidazole glycerol phosphate synthase subunit HisH [Actinomycetota bacterium]